MRYFLFSSFVFMVVFSGCASKLSPTSQDDTFATTLQEQTKQFERFSHEENFDELLMLFRENCKAPQTQKVYAKVCEQSLHVKDAKAFFQNAFVLKKVEPNEQRSMLTGYYEPLLHGSMKKSKRFAYPVYGKPKDLIKIVGENDAKMRGRSVKGKSCSLFYPCGNC